MLNSAAIATPLEPAVDSSAAPGNLPATSCGTLLVNSRRQILLCHVTGTNHWDIPKGLCDPGESFLEAARRELHEEAGLEFDAALFVEIGGFDYQKHKRLHLFRLHTPESLVDLGHLVCVSYFPHRITGLPTPEMDDYRWAERRDIRKLCAPRMAERLMALDW